MTWDQRQPLPRFSVFSRSGCGLNDARLWPQWSLAVVVNILILLNIFPQIFRPKNSDLALASMLAKQRGKHFWGWKKVRVLTWTFPTESDHETPSTEKDTLSRYRLDTTPNVTLQAGPLPIPHLKRRFRPQFETRIFTDQSKPLPGLQFFRAETFGMEPSIACTPKKGKQKQFCSPLHLYAQRFT